ncbi:MAG: FecR family protein [bacterium]|nr:FecR family protein [bacterium]
MSRMQAHIKNRHPGGSRRAGGLVFLLSVGCVLAMFASPLLAGSESRALVLAVRGDVQASGASLQAARNLKQNSTVPAGVEIRTGAKSSATLQLSPTLLCRIGANSVVRLEALSGAAGTTRLQLASGSVGAEVQPNSGTKMEVVTPTAIAGVRGTQFIVETDAPLPPQAGGESNPAAGTGDATSDATQKSTVFVSEGTVAVGTPGEESATRDVEAGNKIVSDGETLKLSILEKFEEQKFAIFEAFGDLKKKNFESFMEQVRRNEELKEQMERMKEMP